jgi:CubicO group peptidase (beta-lactamase class C family)
VIGCNVVVSGSAGFSGLDRSGTAKRAHFSQRDCHDLPPSLLGRPEKRRVAQMRPLDAELEPVRAKHGLPALAAAVVKDGAIVTAGAVGVRVHGTDIKVTIDDRFHLGSDTKAMTATLAAMLVEEGKLRWDSTIGEVLGGEAPGINPKLAAVTLE